MKNIFLTAGVVLMLMACNNEEKMRDNSASISEAETDDNIDKNKDVESNQATSMELMQPMHSMVDRMKAMESSNDTDKDFALMMIEHHQGAIDVSSVYITGGTDPELKQMAAASSEKQRSEQEELRKYTEGVSTGKNENAHDELLKPNTEMMEHMHEKGMSENIDKAFAEMMIGHHKSGIEMAKYEIANGKNAELKKMADKMISDMNKEIEEMEKMK